MTPGDKLNQPGKEYILGAQTLSQGSALFQDGPGSTRTARRAIGSSTRQRRSGLPMYRRTRGLRVISSNAKAAFGFVGIPLLVLDEPGALDVVGGSLLADAIDTSLGKPDSDLTVVYVGTLAPASSGWWHDLIDGGTRGRTFVKAIKGDPTVGIQPTRSQRGVIP